MALAMLGFFLLLQEAFRCKELQRPRLRSTKAVHHSLRQLKRLANNLSAHPTQLAEITPAVHPQVVEACDAAGARMGGVFFFLGLDGCQQARLWRRKFPHSMQRSLVTHANPARSINNSNLELCGNVAHHHVVADLLDIRERTVWTGLDNMANVHWNQKGSTTTMGPAACLLQAQALHQWKHQCVPLHDCVLGTANALADDCSQPWTLTDNALLSCFDARHPQPTS